MSVPLNIPAKVLIVDDLEDVRWALSNVIRLEGLLPLLASNGQEALDYLRQELPDVVLLDVGLPDMSGLEVLKQIKAHNKSIPVIMVTAYGKTADAVQAIQNGAYDYMAKPFLNQDVVITVRHALEEKALKAQKKQLTIVQKSVHSLQEVMGASGAIAHLQTEVDQVAKTRLSVLLSGESGTGKEVVARAIHADSTRANKAFVALDCGAIPATLIESELFGHEKGAFTGAHKAVTGAFEMAAGGTLFLDEIGNLPLIVQRTLLRVLETQCVRRVGSTHEKKIDFRLIAATNENLQAAIQQLTFREDLYYRLAEFTIKLPPLRERSEDIVFLAQRFINQTNLELDKQVLGMTIPAQEMLRRHTWPGNVRELRNQVRRATLLCDKGIGMITPELFTALYHVTEPITLVGFESPCEQQAASCNQQACPLPGGISTCTIPAFPLKLGGEGMSLHEINARVIEQVESFVLLQALQQTQNNKAEVARMLRIDYKTLHSKLKKYKISLNLVLENAFQPKADGEV